MKTVIAVTIMLAHSWYPEHVVTTKTVILSLAIP